MPTLKETAELLEWARSVFGVAAQLTTELAADEREMQKADDAVEYRLAGDSLASDAASRQASHREAQFWIRRVTRFDELDAAVHDARGAELSRYPDFEAISRPIRLLLAVVEGIRRTLRITPGGPESDAAKAATYRQLAMFVGELNTIVFEGTAAIDEIALDLRPATPEAAPAFSCLDRYPDEPAGHLGFLEFIGDEVKNAADAKRSMLDRGYSFETLDSMVRGIKWSEAARRAASLHGIPPAIIDPVAQVLQRDLETGAVEKIDELLRPAVLALRDYCRNGAAQTKDRNGSQDETLGHSATEGVTRLVDIYVNGLATANLTLAANVMASKELTVNEKLTQIDKLMPIPPTASAEALGRALGVSKTAIQKTDWYVKKRLGKTDENTARRQTVHDQRRRQREIEMRDDDGN